MTKSLAFLFPFLIPRARSASTLIDSRELKDERWEANPKVQSLRSFFLFPFSLRSFFLFPFSLRSFFLFPFYWFPEAWFPDKIACVPFSFFDSPSAKRARSASTLIDFDWFPRTEGRALRNGIDCFVYSIYPCLSLLPNKILIWFREVWFPTKSLFCWLLCILYIFLLILAS